MAVACVAYAASIVMHEGAHAVTGWLVGGRPTLLSTTDVRGNWSGVSVVGVSAIGVSGSLVNWGIAGCALWLSRAQRVEQASTRWMLWLMCAINGFIPAVYMIVSPLLGFGDWDTVLRQWPGSVVWRGIVAASGVALTWWWMRVAAKRLAGLTGLAQGQPGTDIVRRLAVTSWVTGGGLAVIAGLLSPLGMIWAVGIGLGSTMGTTWPLLTVVDLASERATRGVAGRFTGIPAHRGWVVAGVVVASVFVGVFGRGVALG